MERSDKDISDSDVPEGGRRVAESILPPGNPVLL